MSRTFGVIRCSFWTGTTGRALRKDRAARDLACYLMTGPYSDVCGFYRLTLPALAADLGATERQARGELARLGALDFCGYDDADEVVGVWRQPLYQLGAGNPDDNRLKAVRRQLAKIRHPFARRIESELDGVRHEQGEQEGEGEQQGEGQGQGHAGEASPCQGLGDGGESDSKPLLSPSQGLHLTFSPPPAPVTPFGQWVAEHWADVKEPDAWGETLSDAYPVIDVLGEARRALAWELSNPANRKKAHGKFFAGWLSRAQDKGTGLRRDGTQTARQTRSPQTTPASPPSAFQTGDEQFRRTT